MPRYLACRARVSFDDGSPEFTDEDANVEIEDGRILITYFDERGAVVFQGREESPGRYALVARSRPRRAELLHREGVLEGSWTEGDLGGSLRVDLAREDGG